MPESLRDPGDLATLDRAVAAASKSLDRYPRSGLLRQFLAQLLRAGQAENRHRRAAEFLVAGTTEALDDRQRDRCQALLDKMSRTETVAVVRREAARTKRAADERLHGALDALRQGPVPGRIEAVRDVVATELPRLTRIAALARRYRLAAEVRQLEETAAQLRQVGQRLGEGEG